MINPTVLCTLYGVPWNDGLAFATLVHESQAILMILAGVVAAVVLNHYGANKFRG